MKQPRVEQLYVFLVEFPDGSQGLVTHGTQPLVAASLERIQELRPLAQQFVDEMQMPVTLALFTERSDVIKLTPTKQ